MTTIRIEERHPLKEKTKCAEQPEKNSICNRIMTTPNFTALVLLIVLVCILGEVLAKNLKEHGTILTTSPESLSLLSGQHGNVTYTFKKDTPESFTVYLNTSKELSLNTNSLQFSSKKKTNILDVEGVGLTSRAFIDVKSCIYDDSKQPCNFNTSDVYVSVKVAHSSFLTTLIEVTGWVYFVAWSVSFYPQIVLNFRRKSVEGLHFDFLLLNTIGFSCYSVYNVMMFFDPVVEDQYMELHPRAQNPVTIQDVVFALHALTVCILTGIQCFFYERANQRVSYVCMLWSTILVGFAVVSLGITVFKVINWLSFIYMLSYVKMAVTLSKYTPQVLLNYRRKSTVGWSIGNILLDFTGGSMEIVQMVLQGANTNDWSGFAGNPVKFGLGLTSMVFDVIFMIQHYCLYRNVQAYEINHEADDSTETVVQNETQNDEEAGAFDNGVYH
ncbi:Cystinosin [Aphelenchoides bicaudatus]|nr:Cystinosin [Aphelenchoides bicaudatus]